MSAHKTKKRKKSSHASRDDGHEDTSKPSAVFKPAKTRQHTLSIALPGSIIANALTHDAKTALAGQIARACAVFCVDEVVVFDDGQAPSKPPEQNGYTAFADPDFFLFHILSYLETPPNLRTRLFPIHPDLRTAGALPSLDMPHHLRSHESCPYREGVVVDTTTDTDGLTSALVDCGLQHNTRIPTDLEKNTRVTVKLASMDIDESRLTEATAVSPEAPREEAGFYWGYSVRQSSSLSGVFTECPFDGGYDISIGTSERGGAVQSMQAKDSMSYVEPIWNHLLIVFGGVAGLEAALTADEELRSAGVRQVDTVFDRWVNVMPGQGSRTIRTEEAVWIGLTALRPLVEARNAV